MTPKILYIATAHSWRGGEQQLVYLYEELHNKNVEQAIVCSKDSELEHYCQTHKLAHYALPKRSSIDLKFAKEIAKIAREGNFDIVDIHDSHAHTFAILACLFFGLKQKLVLHRKVDYAISKSFFSHYKYNHPQIKKIICVSQEVKRVISKSLKDPSKCEVVHDGIDLEKFIHPHENILRQKFNISENVSLIGNVSAVTQQKDYFTFVETARLCLLQNQQLHFFIIGNGDQLEEIKTLVETLKINSHFTFTGFRNDINHVLPCLDMLLFTSEKEGLGTTILDAFVANVPVVATNAGGISELIEHKETGWLAGVKKPEELAVGVLCILGNHNLKDKLVNQARQKAKGFSKKINAEKTLVIYQEIMAK